MLTNLKEKIFLAGEYNGLEVINGWSLPVHAREKTGKYKDSSGNSLTGVFKRKTGEKNTKILIINKGIVINDYNLPCNLNYSPVYSPMVSWKNIYYHQKTYVIADNNTTPLGRNLTALFAIIEESKPCSRFYIYSDIQLDKSIKIMKKFNLAYKIRKGTTDLNNNSTYFINAAKKGYIHEYIDINNYISLLYNCTKSTDFDFFKIINISKLCTILDREIIEIMDDFNYWNESSVELIVATGICLGYPPEAIIGYLMKESTWDKLEKFSTS